MIWKYVLLRLLSLYPALLPLLSCEKPSVDGIVSDTLITSPVEPAPANEAVTSDSAKTYLALGDSYTIGENVKAMERYPAQTVALLQQANIKTQSPLYLATTGWTTTNLMNAINSATLHPPYDVVTLLIGVNDQFQLRDTTGYRSRFTQLLKKSISLARGKSHVFVISIPDYSVTPFVPISLKQQVSKEIDQFNMINKQVADKYSVNYVDVTPSSREAATNSALIARDQLHFSGLEYAKWAALLAPQINLALQ